KIVFACDAGMGSSAMGATVLRKKVRAAGFDDVEVTNKAISSLDDEWDVVVTQKELTDRAHQRTGSAVHVSVDQFMNSPRYDEVVELVEQRNSEGGAAAESAAATTAATPPQGRHAAERPQEEAPATAAPSDGAAILAADSIVLSGTARDSASGIDEAGDLLVAAGAVDEGYVAAMHDREATVSTFMGNGLAIPHGTNEAKSSIQRSAMSFVRYPDGIDWNGNPTTFVIGIAGVGNEHLELLQKVAMTFSDPAQVQRLEDATTTEEILEILGDTKE
ncbi:MAG: PTS sugar transporter subunit IIA, partial [Brachybacterium sp.]|nr:PTS sugar transporter subunit IIA [Brachybacterium sp.]